MREIRNPALRETESDFWSILRPVLVFVSLGVTILILWFWVPRLVWPDQYVGDVPVRASARKWSSGQTMVSRSGGPAAPPGASRTAPPGFTRPGGRSSAPERGVSDPTIVRPRSDMGTRTRLEGRRSRDE